MCIVPQRTVNPRTNVPSTTARCRDKPGSKDITTNTSAIAPAKSEVVVCDVNLPDADGFHVLQWAVDSGRCWPSPVGLLVHDEAGLFLSFRGALALPDRLDLAAPPTRPCDTCAAPCTTACPVSALAERQAYDVSRCQAHVASPEGAACRQGCLVRRACPVAKDFQRRTEQSTFHMSAFMRHYRP